MKKRQAIIALALLITAAAALAATVHSSRGENARPAEHSPALQARCASADLVKLGDPFEIGGDVHARETAVIVSRIMADVREIRVKPGDAVRAGEPLVLLDDRDLAAAVARAQAGVTAAHEAVRLAQAEQAAAQASLTLASATFRRISELRAKNSATPHEMDEAEAGLRAAEARVKSADAQAAQASVGIEVAEAASKAASVTASYAALTAPFSGVVTQKLVEVGNMASPGMPLLTIEDTTSFRLDVRIDESRGAWVHVGQTVDVTLDALPGDVEPQRIVTGHVTEVSRALDAGAHAFLAKIDLAHTGSLRSGMFGRARFEGPARTVLAVPEASVMRRGQITSVFVVDPSGRARLRLVSVGDAAGGHVEIRAGLDAGETVVVDPPAPLVDGMSVTASRTATTAEAR